MTKQEQFLWIVQTVFLADVANIHQMGISQVYRADISGTGTFITMDDAIWASGRIPEEMPLDLHGLLALDELHDSLGVAGIRQGPSGKQHHGQALVADRYVGQELLDHDESDSAFDRPFDRRHASGDDDDHKYQGELVVEEIGICILRIDHQQGAAETRHR